MLEAGCWVGHPCCALVNVTESCGCKTSSVPSLLMSGVKWSSGGQAKGDMGTGEAAQRLRALAALAQNPDGGLQSSASLVLRDLVPSSGLHRYKTHN